MGESFILRVGRVPDILLFLTLILDLSPDVLFLCFRPNFDAPVPQGMKKGVNLGVLN